MLQGRDSLFDPGHCFPPRAGRGLVHVRNLICSPEPHDLEQAPQGLQSLQRPSTRRAKTRKVEIDVWSNVAKAQR